jgi:hypothetical protein
VPAGLFQAEHRASSFHQHPALPERPFEFFTLIFTEFFARPVTRAPATRSAVRRGGRVRNADKATILIGLAGAL